MGDTAAANMSRDEYTERFAFNVEWYDASAMLVRKYQLFYYPKEALIEMVRQPVPQGFSIDAQLNGCVAVRPEESTNFPQEM